jgi:A/G-specific adenine glycosylase
MEQTKEYFVRQLLAWFQKYQRDLPWRRNKNPYYIWVSEVMLQQTRVDTVVPYFQRFIEKFPTLSALADAPEEEVLKSWEGLGYYSRARNLHAAVKEVKEKYNAEVPRDQEKFSALKGVGPYTAGAVLSIAYGLPLPALDGNVMRVLSRYFLIAEDITKGSTRAYMERLLHDLIPPDAAGDFNQALMELGALVCTPKSPHCLTCPVMEQCAGRLEGVEETLPVKKKGKPPRLERRLVAYVRGEGRERGKILVRQRPEKGLLAKMWELPHVELEDAVLIGREPQAGDYLAAKLLAQDNVRIAPGEWLMEAEHTFSHIHWNLQVFACRPAAAEMELKNGLDGRYRWISLAETEQYAFPNVFLKILRALKNK